MTGNKEAPSQEQKHKSFSEIAEGVGNAFVQWINQKIAKSSNDKTQRVLCKTDS